MLLKTAAAVPLLDTADRRKMLRWWGLRQWAPAVLAVLFWEHWWVRWPFALAVVLATIHLTALLLGGPLLKRRVERSYQRALEQEVIWAAEEALQERVQDEDNGGDRQSG